jgi:hypothetical protein
MEFLRLMKKIYYSLLFIVLSFLVYSVVFAEEISAPRQNREGKIISPIDENDNLIAPINFIDLFWHHSLARLKDDSEENGNSWTPLQFGFGIPSNSQLFNDAFSVYGFRLGVIGCHNQNIKGIDISGCWTDTFNNVSGIQLAGLANFVEQESVGIQISGFDNISNKKFSGLQIGGLSCATNLIEGFQFSGFSNFGSCNGIQLSILSNNPPWAGYNYPAIINGIQIAAFNKAKEINGVQFGIFNETEHLKGVQIGLLNLSNNSWTPIIKFAYSD